MRDIDDVVVQAFPVKFEGSKIVLENLNCIDEWLLTCQLDPVVSNKIIIINKLVSPLGGRSKIL